jgi:hypothetical protein
VLAGIRDDLACTQQIAMADKLPWERTGLQRARHVLDMTPRDNTHADENDD